MNLKIDDVDHELLVFAQRQTKYVLQRLPVVGIDLINVSNDGVHDVSLMQFLSVEQRNLPRNGVFVRSDQQLLGLPIVQNDHKLKELRCPKHRRMTLRPLE
jgi:hypothetical protein